MAGHHLAQLNVARLHQPIDHPDNAEFVDALGHVNELAEASDGFVWRLTDESGQSSTYVSAGDDPRFVINLSVWESPDRLREFTYKTEHVQFLRRRREWFEEPDGLFLACWWVPAGTEPTVDEALDKLDQLKTDGPSEAVFGFRETFPAP